MPRSKVEYRGVVVEEMDLDAVLARKPPGVAIVDEMRTPTCPAAATRSATRTCSSCSRAGINVIGAFNIQHLECLNDLVERVTGVRVRETIPDSFLKQADQVVNLDLAVEDLLERLKAGKIYAHDKIPWALEHFFKRSQPRDAARAGAARGGREPGPRSAAQAARRGEATTSAARAGA